MYVSTLVNTHIQGISLILIFSNQSKTMQRHTLKTERTHNELSLGMKMESQKSPQSVF